MGFQVYSIEIENENETILGTALSKLKIIFFQRQQTFTSQTKVQFADDNFNEPPKPNNLNHNAEFQNGLFHSIESPRKKKPRTLSESSYVSSMSSSSTSLSNNIGSVAYSFKAPDGGWGWVSIKEIRTSD